MKTERNYTAKKEHILLVFIILFGFILRLINIDKPEGLWNDEYVSWFVASTPFCKGFWQEVLKQCHMPLYYLYLKPFSSGNDLILRLTSVISCRERIFKKNRILCSYHYFCTIFPDILLSRSQILFSFIFILVSATIIYIKTSKKY